MHCACFSRSVLMSQGFILCTQGSGPVYQYVVPVSACTLQKGWTDPAAQEAGSWDTCPGELSHHL